jgi:hypothetical protein
MRTARSEGTAIMPGPQRDVETRDAVVYCIGGKRDTLAATVATWVHVVAKRAGRFRGALQQPLDVPESPESESNALIDAGVGRVRKVEAILPDPGRSPECRSVTRTGG